MNLRAEAVIVGGGVIGTSVARHLACAGVRDVVRAERDARRLPPLIRTDGLLAAAYDTRDRWIPRLAEAMRQRAPALLGPPPHRRLGGPVREHTRPQRPDRRGAHGVAVHVRHRLLRARLPSRPAVGEVIRDLCLGRVPFLDISPLSAGRFAADAPRPEANPV